MNWQIFFICPSRLAPKTGCDIGQLAVGDLVQTLIRQTVVKRSEMCQVGTQLDIVEVFQMNGSRQQRTAAIPCRMQPFVLHPYVMHERVDFRGGGIAAHQRNTSDIAVAISNQRVQCLRSQRFPLVGPQIRGMTTRTATGASREVHRQSHLIGHLLEDNVAI